jgi:hypothetical protein
MTETMVCRACSLMYRRRIHGMRNYIPCLQCRILAEVPPQISSPIARIYPFLCDRTLDEGNAVHNLLKQSQPYMEPVTLNSVTV